MHRRATAADLAQAGAQPGHDLRRDILKLIDHQVRQRPQLLMVEQLEVLRGVLAKQREHAVIGHDGRGLGQQVVFQRPPEQAQRLKKEAVRVILGKAHFAHCGGHVQPQVFDKTGSGDETVEQRRRAQLALEPVIKPRACAGITCQGADNTLGSIVIFKPYQWLVAESLKQRALDCPLGAHTEFSPGTADLRVLAWIEAQHHPGIQLGNITVAMEL